MKNQPDTRRSSSAEMPGPVPATRITACGPQADSHPDQAAPRGCMSALDARCVPMAGRHATAAGMALCRTGLRSGASRRPLARAMLTGRQAGLTQLRQWHQDWMHGQPGASPLITGRQPARLQGG